MKDDNEERVRIPGFKRYVIDRLGRIFVEATEEELPWHRSNGYRFIRIVADDGRKRSVGQHRALALAFIPMPRTSEQLTVNHRDGNKSNNVIDNLEWVTYGGNADHAYQTGLRTDRIPVVATRISDGETIRFPTISKCAQFFEVSRELFAIKRRGERHLRYGDFVLEFMLDESTWGAPNEYPNGVMARSIATGEVVAASTVGQLGKLLSVEPKLIKRVIRARRFRYPVYGYDFRAVDGETNWPTYSAEEIEAFKGEKFIHQPVRVISSDGTAKLFGNILAASKFTGTHERSIRQSLKYDTPCYNGFVYRRYHRPSVENL
jgi:hypothetical protein